MHARRSAALIASVALAAGCGEPLYKTKHPTDLAVGSVLVAGAGVGLFLLRSGCSYNSEDANACTYEDDGRDLGMAMLGGLLIATGVTGVFTALYAAARNAD